jgi:CMP-N,N'-diacetyllegionaminic acid synthase
MNILAIIPARGGSKGIPKKNIITIAGKPLIAWTIESAQKSRLVNRVVVSSDSPEILSVAKKYGSEIITRPAKFANDKISAVAAVPHTLEYLKKKEKYIPDIIVFLQPTSPLRTSKDIDDAIRLFIQKKAGAVISVTEGDNKALKSFFIEKGIMRGIVNDEFPFTNRQALPKIYMPNGAIFIISEKEFQKEQRLFSKKTYAFIMPEERSIDLDVKEDIPALVKLLKKK